MSRTRIKFCGMMRPDDARAAALAGADAVGMILYSGGTPRQIDLPAAQRIAGALPPFVSTVGVFVGAEASRVVDYVNVALLHTAQLHGEETPDDVARCGAVPVIKALRADKRFERTLAEWVECAADLPNLVGLLIDGPKGGGTGEAYDLVAVKRLLDRHDPDALPPILIAGGLRPDNVASVIDLLRPYAVDTSSGVESAVGEKSAEKLRAFADAVQAVDQRHARPTVGTRAR